MRPPAPAKPRETPKEAIIGLVISFAVVLIYRGFVFETFHIPTGSMAPTLRGAHMQFTSPQSGFTWAVNPWSNSSQPPTRVQGSATSPVRVSDPVTGVPIQPGAYPLRAGDRIAVLKYNALHRPQRWDVIVFKMPEGPRENYIKRLIGLPNEDLWLVDGDVFVRPSPSSDSGAPHESGEWRIARKPAYIQNSVWWTIHSSEFTPVKNDFDGVPWRSPWQGEGWTHDAHGVLRADAASPGPLTWDASAWPITDFTPYNQVTPWAPNRRETTPRTIVYPTSDLRVRAGVDAPYGAVATFRIEARNHVFEATLAPYEATISMRPLAADAGEPNVLVRAHFDGFTEGRVVDVEFIHADQALELRVDGRTLARAEYDWSPLERLRHATVLTDEQLDAVLANPGDTRLTNKPNSLGVYTMPSVSIQIARGPATLHRVGLDRDLYYQPAEHYTGPNHSRPGLGAHPLTAASMGEGEYFAAGDNSGNSRDSRLWDVVNPWVEGLTGVDVGLVPHDLLMGEAVLVFWPAPNTLHLGPLRIPFVPDVGRVRLIK